MQCENSVEWSCSYLNFFSGDILLLKHVHAGGLFIITVSQ